jgi:hypothetical protein
MITKLHGTACGATQRYESAAIRVVRYKHILFHTKQGLPGTLSSILAVVSHIGVVSSTQLISVRISVYSRSLLRDALQPIPISHADSCKALFQMIISNMSRWHAHSAVFALKDNEHLFGFSGDTLSSLDQLRLPTWPLRLTSACP